MRKWLFLLVGLLLAVTPIFAQEDVYLRFAHFAVDGPAIDIYINEELIYEDLEFPNVSDWVVLDADTYTIDIVETGEEIEDAVLTDEYDLDTSDWVTLTILGEVGCDDLFFHPLIDDLSDIALDETFVGVFHGISDLNAINIFLNDTELATSLAFPETDDEAEAYASDTVVADDYSFEIQDDDDNIVLSEDARTLSEGLAYFVAAVGTADDPQFVFISTEIASILGQETDETEDEEVEIEEGTLLARLGHFSASASLIDIYIDDELFLEGADYGDVTDYLEFDSGIYDVALVPTGEDPDDALYEGKITLFADTITLIAAIGFIGDDSLTVVTARENNRELLAGETRLAFFQAIPSIQLFDLIANGSTLIQGVAYPEVFAGAGDGYVSVDVIATVYELSIEGASDTIDVGNITTGTGRVYLVVSAGTEFRPVYFLISNNFPSEEED